MRTDGRTDMTKLTFTLRNFDKAPKNVWNYEFVIHKPLLVMVFTFRIHNYTIRHDLPSPLIRSICIDITYQSSDLLIFLIVVLLVIGSI
jgi:hypothetical protein